MPKKESNLANDRARFAPGPNRLALSSRKESRDSLLPFKAGSRPFVARRNYLQNSKNGKLGEERNTPALPLALRTNRGYQCYISQPSDCLFFLLSLLRV